MPHRAFYVAVPAAVFVLGLLGTMMNVITLTVIARSKKLRGPFHILLMSLCVSDIFGGTDSLFWAIGMYLTLHNPNNQLYRYADLFTYIPTMVTANHVCCFCVFRFVSCQWPHKKISSGLAKWTAGILWGCTTVFSSIFIAVVHILPHVERQYTFVFVPRIVTARLAGTILSASMVFVTLFTSALLLSLYHSRKDISQLLSDEARQQRSARDKHISVQLVLIALSFYVGYIPLTAFFWLQRTTNSIASMHPLRHAAYLCLRVSECLNPIFYNAASETMRKETKNLLKSFPTLCRGPTHRDEFEME